MKYMSYMISNNFKFAYIEAFFKINAFLFIYYAIRQCVLLNYIKKYTFPKTLKILKFIRIFFVNILHFDK